MLKNNYSHFKNYGIILITCVLVSVLGFVFHPHDCKSTYGPAPYYYNTDLTLWVQLADKPISNLDNSILANRPLFAYMGWFFAQPIHWAIDDLALTSATRDGGGTSVPLATVAGLMLANDFCFLLTALILYHFTFDLFDHQDVALLASLLWTTSFFAYAWSYHPVNQMGGLVIIFIFPWLLLRLTPKSTLVENALWGLGMGILMLIKAYYVIPFIYLAWAILFKFELINMIIGFVLFFIPAIIHGRRRNYRIPDATLEGLPGFISVAGWKPR